MTQEVSSSSKATHCESPNLQPEARERDETPSPITGTPQEFPRGEIEHGDPVELDPVEAVNKHVGHRTASVNEAVLSTLAVAEAVDAFKGDSAKSQQWLGNMVRVKALAKVEASAGLDEEKKSASNLSKLRKIAKYEHILRTPKIASLLPSGGFATLYECARLGEALESKNPETAIDDLYSLLIEHDGPVTREWLKKEGEKRRSPRPAKEHDAGIISGASTPEQPSHQAAEPPLGPQQPTEQRSERDVKTDRGAGTSVHKSAQKSSAQQVKTLAELPHEPAGEGDEDDGREVGQPDDVEADDEAIGTVLVNVTGASMSKDDLIEIGKVVESLAEDAIVFLHGPLGLLLSRNADLDLFGVSRCQAIYIVEDIIEEDLANTWAFVTYARGRAAISRGLLDFPTETDPAILADHIIDGRAGRKVLMFGRTDEDGWESIEGSTPFTGRPARVVEGSVTEFNRGH